MWELRKTIQLSVCDTSVLLINPTLWIQEWMHQYHVLQNGESLQALQLIPGTRAYGVGLHDEMADGLHLRRHEAIQEFGETGRKRRRGTGDCNGENVLLEGH
jgi:hypothetical protein